MILEMGARRRGDIRDLCDLVSPTVGIITGIAPQHLETFGTLEDIREEKGELARAVPREGLVVYNLSDEGARTLYEERVGRKLGVGFERADCLIEGLEMTAEGASFCLRKGEKCFPISLPLLGKGAVADFALAAALALELGVSEEIIREKARSMTAAPHRFEVVRKDKILVIDDSYNINPVGASTALFSLSYFEAKRKIVYASGIVELGEETERYNLRLGEEIAEYATMAILGAGKYADFTEQGIKGKRPDFPVIRVADTEEATKCFGHTLREGDLLLIMSDLPRDYLL